MDYNKRVILFLLSFTLSMFAIKYYFFKDELLNKTHTAPATPTTIHQTKKSIQSTATVPTEIQEKSENQHFVLQSNTLQLVFSTAGGSISEINLPFHSVHSQSPVRPIEIDTMIDTTSGQNALFPLHQALKFDTTYLLPEKGKYYPLTRRAQLGKSPLSPAYYPFNIVSGEYPEVAKTTYSVTSFSDKEIVFESNLPHRKIRKKFSLPEDPDAAPYSFIVDIDIDGDTKDLWLTSGVLEVELVSGSPFSNILYRIPKNNSYVVEKVDLPKETFTMRSLTPDWVSSSNGFFSIIIDPVQGTEAGFKVERISNEKAPSRITLLNQGQIRVAQDDMYGFMTLLPIRHNLNHARFRVYAGPLSESILKKVDSYYAQLDIEKKIGKSSPDYTSCMTFHGFFAFISEPFAKFLYFVMKIFYNLFGSWTLSIVLATVVLRIVLSPLNNWSMRSMKRMQEIAPKVQAIQERNKKDPKKAQMEVVQLYRETGVNPLSGCLPLVIQMPFLIGMFDLLKSTFELRGVPFIPGWIDNLTAPDVLFSWNFSIPFIGNSFHVLPLVLGAIMYAQQYMNMPKEKVVSDQARQQQAMTTMMTAIMTIMFYHFPSGLNIYWISSMLLGLLQQWRVNKQKSKV